MATPEILYKLEKNGKITFYKILRETPKLWYVGEEFVTGGYINKASKKYFTDFKKVEEKILITLKKRIKKLDQELTISSMAHDAIEGGEPIGTILNLLEHSGVFMEAVKNHSRLSMIGWNTLSNPQP